MQMPTTTIDLLAIQRGAVTAPAGCGKTHLIAEALKRHRGSKPVLVLTHTNAGVAALRGRLLANSVPSSAYRISTIDGWALRLISTFPQRAAFRKGLLDLKAPGRDYPEVRWTAAKLIHAGHISDVIEASYARLLVDEYQDCSTRQHTLVGLASEILPTCVLGDPLQAIFNFGTDPLADWGTDVCGHFPIVGELSIPWRWVNAGNESLGQWLLQVRKLILRGQAIDLKGAPACVSWVELNGVDDHSKLLRASRIDPPSAGERVLIIGSSMNADSRHRIASSVHGAVTVEAVDLRDLVNFAATLQFDEEDALRSLQSIANFAHSVMSNVNPVELVKRVQTLQKGTHKKGPSETEISALAFVASPLPKTALDLLVEISKESGVRTYRPALVRACIRALQMCSCTDGMSFHQAVIHVREQQRFLGRPLSRRSVGSTLLLKGLEAEVVVVLNAGELDPRNLYVAMTRGSKGLVVCSRKSTLRPS